MGLPVLGLAFCGGASGMGVVFVLAVAGGFELEGGVFDGMTQLVVNSALPILTFGCA